jgi:hypothetical protein
MGIVFVKGAITLSTTVRSGYFARESGRDQPADNRQLIIAVKDNIEYRKMSQEAAELNEAIRAAGMSMLEPRTERSTDKKTTC